MESNGAFLFEEDLVVAQFHEVELAPAASAYVISEATSLRSEEPQFIGAGLQNQSRCKAILDCGASESIIGSHVLQGYRDELDNLGLR